MNHTCKDCKYHRYSLNRNIRHGKTKNTYTETRTDYCTRLHKTRELKTLNPCKVFVKDTETWWQRWSRWYESIHPLLQIILIPITLGIIFVAVLTYNPSLFFR